MENKSIENIDPEEQKIVDYLKEIFGDNYRNYIDYPPSDEDAPFVNKEAKMIEEWVKNICGTSKGAMQMMYNVLARTIRESEDF